MDKLEGLKEGDAVEVTFRGVVDENPTFKTLYVLVEKGGLSSPTIFTEEAFALCRPAEAEALPS